MGRPANALKWLAISLLFQSLTGCQWADTSDQPITLKIATPTEQATPCLAESLGREFQDTLPIVDRGNMPGGHEITVNAPRGGMVAFLTVEPIYVGGGTKVTFYNGLLYWPRRNTSGVFPDVARDNWHRAERAILACDTPSTQPS
jgi:hypothetical protein